MNKNTSPELIVNLSDTDYDVEPSSRLTYLYSIGGGSIRGRNIIPINDARRLHKLASELRDSYADWIYSLNDIYIQRGLIEADLSLFLISDCSGKRTELFDTYQTICNLMLLRESVSRLAVKKIRVIGGTPSFLRALKSICPGLCIVNEVNHDFNLHSVKQYLSDLRFIIEVVSIVFLENLLPSRDKRKDSRPRRYFFTIYPKMMGSNGRDKKYGSYFEEEDRYVGSLITDGLHQHVSVGEYFRLKRQAIIDNVQIIDEFIRFGDCCRCLYWWTRIRWVLYLERAQEHYFKEIDVTGYINKELLESTSRIGRFMVIKGALTRFITSNLISEFVYYLHEYPLGRLISYVFKTKYPKVKTCGYQHGPSSWRKLLYFMTPNETSISQDYCHHVAIPDEVLAEDEPSAEIYRYAGYTNVRVMNTIYRLDYLKGVKRCLVQEYSLIAPGLHDGRSMFDCLKELITSSPENQFCFKPHPLASMDYLTELDELPNLNVSDLAMSSLLARAKEVYVTYSSVGLEAAALGIPVRVVEIPGVINQSPLGDLENYNTLVV